MKRLSMVVFCLVVMGLVAPVTLSLAKEHNNNKCETEMTSGNQDCVPKTAQKNETQKNNKNGKNDKGKRTGVELDATRGVMMENIDKR